MAKSLNQAFIRAYNKVRSEKADSSSEENYIVRLDTTSVSVPEPYMLQNPPPAKEAAGSSVPPPTASAAANSVFQVDSQANAEDEKALRESIANEMIRASDWDDSAIDSFLGGFPTIVTHVTDVQEMENATRPVRRDSETNTAAENQPTASSQRTNSQTAVVEELQVQTTSTTSSNVATTRNYAIETSATEEESVIERVERTTNQLQQIADSVDGDATATPAQASAADKISHIAEETDVQSDTISKVQQFTSEEAVQASAVQSSNTHVEALASPEAPALTSNEVRKIVEDYVAKHSKAGEIFRLDEPSYTQEGSVEEIVAEEESYEEDSIESSPSITDLDVHEEDYAREDMRAIEQQLRKDAKQMFNPGWEVDRLQWPEVCLELIRQREENITRVATNLTEACEEGLQVLAVTSPTGGEGRTTVACCLAKMIAVCGLRVALVDGDIESPSLSSQVNLEVQADWKTAILNQVPFEEVSIYSIEDQLTLLPLTEAVDSKEFASDDNRIAFMLHQLSDNFDLVIIDSGHMDSTRTIVSSLAEQGLVNAVVTVVDHRISTPQRIEACIRRIRRTGVASVGLVENFAA